MFDGNVVVEMVLEAVGEMPMRRCAMLVAMLLFAAPVTAQTISVTLAWDANTESNLAGYQVSYGTASGVYTTVVDVGNVTQVTFTLATGPVYFFAVKAYNVQRQYSPFSIEVNTASGGALRPPGTPIIRQRPSGLRVQMPHWL